MSNPALDYLRKVNNGCDVDTKQCVAIELADMKALQELLIATEQVLPAVSSDKEISDRLNDSLKISKKTSKLSSRQI